MNGPGYGFGGGASLHTPATRGSAAPGDAQGTGPAPEAEASGTDGSAAPTITIRWRRYGKTGGRWRADLPPGHGLDSGWIESPQLDLVRDMAKIIAARRGWTVTTEETDEA